MTRYSQHSTRNHFARSWAGAGAAAGPTSRRWLSLTGIAAGVFVLALLLSPTGAPPAAAQSTPVGTRLPSGAWTQHTPATRPAGLAGHAIAYDPSTQRVVLFGGTNQPYNPRGTSVPQPTNATWLWDGTTWTRAETPLDKTPPARFGHAMAFGQAVIDRAPILVSGVITGYTVRTTFDGIILFGGAHWGEPGGRRPQRHVGVERGYLGRPVGGPTGANGGRSRHPRRALRPRDGLRQ